MLKKPSLKPEQERLLKIRAMLKEKTPSFIRQESWRLTRVKPNWRRPRGIDNKIKKKIKGWPKMPNVGYRGPKAVRDLHPSGYRDLLIYNISMLDKVNPHKDAIRLSRNIGRRKKIEIIQRADKLGIRVLNRRVKSLGES